MSELEQPRTQAGPPEKKRALRRDIVVVVTATLLAAAGVVFVHTRTLAQMDVDQQNVLTFLITMVGAALIVGWFWFSSPISWLLKFIVPIGMIALLVALFRIEITGGNMGFRVVSRLQPRPDELLETSLARVAVDRELVPPTSNDYPRFLGENFRATVRGFNLETDWAQHPPREVWRNDIGAGWSGFAIVGNQAVTQEQRGNQEMVTCYELDTGRLLWAHSDEGRFSEFLGGDGPRATPTIHEGKVYALGAFGILNCLNLATGQRIWSRDIAKDNETKPPYWGYSGSPLIVDDMVVVSAGNTKGKSLVTYQKETGEPIWQAGSDRSSYASPQLMTLVGKRQILSINEGWLRAHRVEDGKELWEFEWPSTSDREACASQPVPLGGDRVFLSKGYQQGFAIIQVASNNGQFTADFVRGNKRYMKTKMANIVLRDGFAYGLSGGFLECLELASGRQRWKQGHNDDPYGHGQIMLIDDTILVVSEAVGDVALVRASPERFEELARIELLSDTTWNNPALAGRLLLVRNHREAVCLELPVRGAAE